MPDIKKKLQDEITTLEHELHVELPKEILTARAHGDLSENAEYHAAKERQGWSTRASTSSRSGWPRSR
jgi:transcription elongation factor GreA